MSLVPDHPARPPAPVGPTVDRVRATTRAALDLAVTMGADELAESLELALEDLDQVEAATQRLRALATPKPETGAAREELTARQLEFVEWLRDWLRRWGVWPTHRVIMEVFEWRSTNAVADLLRVLERRGYIERTRPPGQAASWRLTGR